MSDDHPLSRLRELVYCPVCYELMEVPKSLACAHTVCVNCLKGIVTASSKAEQKKLKCPTCRMSTNLDEGGVDALPNNPVIVSIKDMLAKEPDRLTTSTDIAAQMNETGQTTGDKVPSQGRTDEDQQRIRLLVDRCSEEISRLFFLNDQHMQHTQTVLEKIDAWAHQSIQQIIDDAKGFKTEVKEKSSQYLSRLESRVEKYQDCVDMVEGSQPMSADLVNNIKVRVAKMAEEKVEELHFDFLPDFDFFLVLPQSLKRSMSRRSKVKREKSKEDTRARKSRHGEDMCMDVKNENSGGNMLVAKDDSYTTMNRAESKKEDVIRLRRNNSERAVGSPKHIFDRCLRRQRSEGNQVVSGQDLSREECVQSLIKSKKEKEGSAVTVKGEVEETLLSMQLEGEGLLMVSDTGNVDGIILTLQEGGTDKNNCSK